MTNNVAIFINLPDEYVDVYHIFKFFYKQYWKTNNIPIYISTDTFFDDELENANFICCGKNSSSQFRLYKGLNTIKQKYVLLLDCDYFLTNEVDEKAIYNFVALMENYDLNYISLFKRRKTYTCKSQISKSLRFIKKNKRYGICLMCSLVNKKVFLDMFQDKQYNGWEIEEYFLKKTINETGCYNDCMLSTYNPIKFIHAVRSGKWTKSGYKYAKKAGVDPSLLNKRRKLSFLENFKTKMSKILSLILPLKTIRFFKKIMNKIGFNFKNPY